MAFSWVLMILYSSVKFRNNSTLLVCKCDFLLHLCCCCCWAFSVSVPFFHFSSGFWLSDVSFRPEVISPLLCLTGIPLVRTETFFFFYTKPRLCGLLLAANCSALFMTKLQGTRTWRWVTRLFIPTTFPGVIFQNNTIVHSGRSPCYFAPALLAHGRSSCTWPVTSAAQPKGLPTMQCFLTTNCGLNLIQAWFLYPSS